jgi:hypothetical protein
LLLSSSVQPQAAIAVPPIQANSDSETVAWRLKRDSINALPSICAPVTPTSSDSSHSGRPELPEVVCGRGGPPHPHKAAVVDSEVPRAFSKHGGGALQSPIACTDEAAQGTGSALAHTQVKGGPGFRPCSFVPQDGTACGSRKVCAASRKFTFSTRTPTTGASCVPLSTSSCCRLVATS